ncbi:MAG: dicarboxylate/amino acid:cation symporter [Gammaproteobacteria bacterium]|nr:dicarboxylate/amino acid:cation symporter [Gammaproteobacteria bacterium]
MSLLHNPSLRILIGLTLGLLGGIAVSFAESGFLSTLPALIEPIGALWVNGIRMTVIPLLMALLVTAIAGQQSTGVVAKLGGKTISLFIILIGIASFYTLILAPPLLSLLNIDPAASENLLARTGAAAVTETEIPPFRDWLVNLIPANPFQAAVDNAVLSLLVFTGLFSVALLHIGPAERETMVIFFAAIKDTMFVLINWIMKLAPYGIFGLAFPLAANLGLSAISVLGSFIVVTCGLILLMMLALYPIAVFAGKIPLQQFSKAAASIQIIGFSTRSSLAALPATFAATESLGISHKISGVVLPIAFTLFKFASPIGRIAGTFFVAQLYGIDLAFYEMLIISLAIGLFSFYSPGIPSGGLLIMSPVYISLGLPVEGIGILIALDLVIDMFLTMTNVTANLTAVALLSRQER